MLISDHALNYLVLPFWLDCSTPLVTKNFLKQQGCVASMQYSKRCKLFMFPKELLKEEWLSTINFFTVKKESGSVELVGIIVLKLVESAGYEISIIPEPLKIDNGQRGHKAFKLVKEKNCIFEKGISLKEIATKKAEPTIQNDDQYRRSSKKSTMFDDIVNSEDMPSN